MEILDIVNDKNEVIGNASYEDVHIKKQRHRVVVAMLINDGGEVLIQLRASTKSAHPLYWSFSAGGHVRHGESYIAAVKREVKEEIGVSVSKNEILLKGEGTMREQSGGEVFYEAYEIMYDGPVEEKTKEVDAVQFVTWKDLRHMIEEGKEKIHPQMVLDLKRHWSKELSSF